MKQTIRHSMLLSIRIFMMLFWLYVAIDKLWNLSAFHTALQRQPFPDVWADILYWLLPTIELMLGLTLISDKSLSNRVAYLLSSLLLLPFTIYIALGVLGLYTEQPCGCASVFKGITWNQHLLINILLLSLTILGWYLTGPTTPIEHRNDKIDAMSRTIPSTHNSHDDASSTAMIHAVSLFKRYRMLFNLFPVSG